MTAGRILTLLSAGLLLAAPAYADIGAVGSPVVPSNPPPAQPAAVAPPAAAPAAPVTAVPTETGLSALPVAPLTQKPLLVIRFNQKAVSFQRALRTAISGAEHAKNGVIYSVVSYVPAASSKSQGDRSASEANDNLNAVLSEMVSAGVSSNRIGTSSLTSPAGGSQEIHIYVQ